MSITTKSLENRTFVTKIRGLVSRTLLKEKTDTSKDDSSKHMNRVLSAIIISGGASWIISRYGSKIVGKAIVKKEREESTKLKEALMATHTSRQKSLWEEIKRSQDEIDSIKNIIVTSVFNEGKGSSFSFNDLIATLFLSKKKSNLDSQSKWLSIQLRKYEDSLNSNQLTIYKNLFETEYRILAKLNLIKAIMYVGIPILAYHLLAWNQKDNIKAWEKALSHG
jgi:hypothetical protein